jgi:hypothetical protein
MLIDVAEKMRIKHSGRPGTIISIHPSSIRVQFDEGNFLGAGMSFYYLDRDYSDPLHTWWEHLTEDDSAG